MPRTTTLHPRRIASDRQRELIRTMEQERGLSPWVATNSPFLTFREASQRIDELRNTRPHVPVPVGEELPVPQGTTRTGRMILAGQVSATVTSRTTGQHVTIFARTLRRRNRAIDRPGRSTWVACSPLEPGATMYLSAARRGRRIGRISEGFAIRWQFGTTVEVKDAVRALFGFARAADSEGGYGAYRIQVADSCGRCGRELTDPESIERGIGPDCLGQLTSSQHAQVFLAPNVPESNESRRVARVDPVIEAEVAEAEVYVTEDQRTARVSFTEWVSSLATPPLPAPTPGGYPEVAEEPTLTAVARARDLIARALKYQSEDEGIDPSDVEFALGEFDRMARSR